MVRSNVMPKLASKPLILITEGTVIGQLVVGELLPSEDPRMSLVPLGYQVHGRVRECFCSCGKNAFYSEYALARGKLKSCGHLRFIKLLNGEKNREIRKQIKDLRERISTLNVHYQRARQLGNTKAESGFMETLQDLHSQIKALKLRLV